MDEKKAAESASDNSKVTESSSSIQSTEPKAGLDTATNEAEQIVKPQDGVTEKEVALTETTEKHEEISGTEPKAKGTSENNNEVNVVETSRVNDKARSDVVLQQETVVPLRSKGKLKIEK